MELVNLLSSETIRRMHKMLGIKIYSRILRGCEIQTLCVNSRHELLDEKCTVIPVDKILGYTGWNEWRKGFEMPYHSVYHQSLDDGGLNRIVWYPTENLPDALCISIDGQFPLIGCGWHITWGDWSTDVKWWQDITATLVTHALEMHDKGHQVEWHVSHPSFKTWKLYDGDMAEWYKNLVGLDETMIGE